MSDPNVIILYVQSPERSARFYADLLGAPAIEQSPTFAMLPLRSGIMLGLWRRDTVAPAVTGSGGGGEIAFTDPDVDGIHADWSSRGVVIMQPPTDMDFGRTFTAADPDGHRLRVFAPSGDL